LLRVALATLYMPNTDNACVHGVGCALLPWCLSARRLKAALTTGLDARVDVIALYAPRTAEQLRRRTFARPEKGQTCWLSSETEVLDMRDCPGLQLYQPSAALVESARFHVRRAIAGGIVSTGPEYMRRMQVTIHKWELLRLGEAYDAILFTDLDVDVMPSHADAAAVAREWSTHLPPLAARRGRAKGRRRLDRRLHLLSFGDATSPFLASVFWVFPPPSEELYWEGVAVVRAAWNATHGWNHSGVPAELFATPPRYADGSVAPRFDVATFGSGWDRIDGGDLDQGLFLYMLHHRHAPAGALMRQTGEHRLFHYNRINPKPWTRSLAHAATNKPCGWETLKRHAYLRGAGLLGHQLPPTACGRAFGRVAAELDLVVNRTRCCAQWKAPPETWGRDALGVF
jgi:hypothetical protein